MTHLERLIALLERHRYDRAWSDETVARDVLALYEVDPDGIVDPTAEEIAAAERVAKEAAHKLAALKGAVKPVGKPLVAPADLKERPQADPATMSSPVKPMAAAVSEKPVVETKRG